MRQAMEPVVHPEDLGSITTKSWRQVGPTWAALTDLNATDLCALGNWQEKGEVGSHAAPLPSGQDFARPGPEALPS